MEKTQPHAVDANALPTDLHKPGTFKVILVVLVFLGLLGTLFAVGWFPHQRREHEAVGDARERSSQLPVVEVVQPKSSSASKEILVPGDVRSFQETSIFPRANGYLKRRLVDIGDKVQAGQLLAEIETPDVDADLAQNRANLEQAKTTVTKAQFDLDLAKKTLDRYEAWYKANSGGVTELQLDQTRSAYNTAVSAVASAKANVLAGEAAVQHSLVLQGFEKVTAPFAGIVTVRNYDVGALLSSSNTAREMFRIAQTDVLRVFVNIPQPYATEIKTGKTAVLNVRNYPGRDFQGTVARTAGAIDPTTRTLSVEIHFPNPDGALYSGMYGQVRLLITEQRPVLVVPSSAVVFNTDGLIVQVAQNDKVTIRKVKVGRDLGTEMEITDGLTPQDQVLSNPSERFTEGMAVKVIKA